MLLIKHLTRLFLHNPNSRRSLRIVLNTLPVLTVVRHFRGVSNLTPASAPANSAPVSSRDSSPDASNLSDASGLLVVYADEENGESDLSARVANEEHIERAPGNASSSECSLASYPATPQSRPATPQECPANPQQRSSQPQRTPSSQMHGRNIPAGAASLPYLGPTSRRSMKRKSEDEATAFSKDTLMVLSQSWSQPSSQNADLSSH